MSDAQAVSADGEESGDYEELEDVSGIGSETAEALREAGFESVADLREASVDDLTDVEGFGETRASELKDEVEKSESDRSEDDGSGTDGGVTVDVSDTDEQSDDGELDADDGSRDEDAAGDDSKRDDAENSDAESDEFGLLDARESVEVVADTLIDDPLDSVIEIEKGDDGWFAVVEVVERSAVPDTQDILGRYEIDLDASGSVTGYRLTDRYRRGEVSG